MKLRVPADTVAFVSHLPPPLKQKIRSGLDCLVKNSSEGKPLRAELQGLWSLRVGRFRIVYRVVDRVLEVVAIGPRANIYQETARRLALLLKKA